MPQDAASTSPRADGAPPHRYTASLADALERRWQHAWERSLAFRAPNPGEPGFDPAKPKYYILDMFPYPSGSGLHVGHPEGYTATDIVARYMRMKGYAVLHPMGWDAFGLPAEQYAVQTNVHPRITTQRAIDTFRRQLKRFGFSYDWSREISTIDPAYYKWTQWIWLRCYNSWYDPRANHGAGAARPIQSLIDDLSNERLVIGPGGSLLPADDAAGFGVMGGNPLGGAGASLYRRWIELAESERREVLDSQRLAYLGEQTVNWCPALGTVLANEEVIDGLSERGGHPVRRVALKQWMFRITAYAERLLVDLGLVDWPESTRIQQAEWIGRSQGAEIAFRIDGRDDAVTVFTTRPETLFGATYVVLAPEHPLVEELITDARRHDVVNYLESVSGRSDLERQENREKTGVFTGAFAVNPATGKPVPVWIADYVLMGYGTGAIMAVPAHDERDFEFARKFGLPIRDVVHTPPLAAIHDFCARYTKGSAPGADPLVLLADFVGMALSRPGNDPDIAFREVVERRTICVLDERSRPRAMPDLASLTSGRATAEGALGSAPGDRRGAVAFIWRDALSEVCKGDFSRLYDAAREGRLVDLLGAAVTEPGHAAHSARPGLSINGMGAAQAKAAVAEWIEREGHGTRRVNFKLRDWLFSRQRYWGEPFPILYDDAGVPHPLPPESLPLELPEMADFKPVESDTPTPPLGKATDWASVRIDGRNYRRETNTMPNWAGSCWYYLRYCDPHNSQRFVGAEAERYWMGQGERGGVDLYMGGNEHAVLHLLYARFWHKVLFDLGEVSTPEPFRKLRHQGLILSHAYQRSNGALVPTDEAEETPAGFVHRDDREPLTQIVAKMSKSLKNVVNPDDVIAEFGADTFRLYEMYMGPIEASKPWNTRDIVGPFRFLQRVWRLAVDEETGDLRALPDADANLDVERALHAAIRKVGQDIENLSFNTAIAAMIQFVNEATAVGVTRSQLARFARVISPFAPHIAEELWARLGHTSLVCHEPWPEHDESLLVADRIEIVVQVNGKVRGRVLTAPDADESAMQAAALQDPAVIEALAGKPVRKVIAVKGRLVNLVV